MQIFILKDETCVGDLRVQAGIITYPEEVNSNYTNMQDCFWTITVGEDKIIKLRFEWIDIEPSDTCEYDYLEVSNCL